MMMLSGIARLFDRFHDPRYRTEFLFLVVGIPSALLGAGILVWFLMPQAPVTDATSRQAPPPTPPSQESPQPLRAHAPSIWESLESAITEKRLEDAEALLKQAISNGEDETKCQAALGHLLTDQNKFPEALEAWNRALALNPDAETFFRRAECLLVLKRDAEALKDFEAASQMSPSHTVYTNKLYLVMINRGRAREVRMAIKPQLDIGLSSTMPAWIMAPAALALQENQPDQAAIILRQARQMLPEKDFAYLLQDPAFKSHEFLKEVAPFFNTR